MALNKIKPLDDFLTGARTYNAVNKTTADEFVIHPADNFISCALAMGAPLGNWSTVKDHFADAGATLPVGARVIGSNGKVYEVGTAAAGSTDPTLGGAGWTDVAASGAGGTATGTIPTTFSGDTLPDATKVKTGDAWITGSSPPSPYSKNSKFFWNGASWAFEAGAALTVITAAAPLFTGGTLLSWTPVVDDGSISVSGSTITVNATGGYDIYIQANPGSYIDYTGVDGQQVFYGVSLEVNGATLSASYELTSQPINVSAAGPEMSGEFQAFQGSLGLNAGATLTYTVIASDACKFNGGFTARLRRKW